jgi:DNA processing protein
MNERSYWLGFSLFSGVGPGRFAKLLSAFGSAKDAWDATTEDLEKVLGKALAAKFSDFRLKTSLEDYEEQLHKSNVCYLTLQDIDYPILLAQSKNAPFVLFVKGNLELFYSSSKEHGKEKGSRQTRTVSPTIAIVGTRKITEYGRQVTEMLTTDLVTAGCVIVSGLALGVDAVAHQTTTDNNGRTIAVLGCGVDCCSPRENEDLYNSILAHGGAIVSEYPLGQVPTKGSFLSRNRIIAGLSHGVIVTEGASDSGALYTANDAFANGRKIFAVPGPITSSLSQGPLGLIKKGAKLITTASEVLESLNLGNATSIMSIKSLKGDTKEEQQIIDLLMKQSLHFDELLKRTKINSSQLGSLLSLMEMKGMVKSLEGSFFALL